jgi:hypothetical protein
MGHYYTRSGKPNYFVPKASGEGTRATHIGDARKLGLVPSVTEVLNIANKPGLNNWLVQQAYLAMATLPEIEGETIDSRITRAKRDAGKQAEKSRDLGTAIHDSLESAFLGRVYTKTHQPHIEGVRAKLIELFGDQEWIPEQSFAHPSGYGGKVDLNCPIAVVDFKTKDFGKEDIEKKMAWDEHGIQLAAYGRGLGLNNPRYVNLFISTREPGLVVAHEHTEIDRYLDMFDALLAFWKVKNKYDGRFNQ